MSSAMRAVGSERGAAASIAGMSLLSQPDLPAAAIETLDAPELTGDDHDSD